MPGIVSHQAHTQLQEKGVLSVSTVSAASYPTGMRVARGSASWLSSHGRGLGPRDAQSLVSQCMGCALHTWVCRSLH